MYKVCMMYVLFSYVYCIQKGTTRVKYKMFYFGHWLDYVMYFGQLAPFFLDDAYDRNTNYDNDGCNDNHDGNFHDIHNKNNHKTS